MAGQTYTAKALVVRRTKLGESDVICTLLLSDGSQVRAVAKGARKPSSVFSSRLELFSLCDLLLAKGKNLDIVKEARLVEAHVHLKTDIALFEAASPVLEFLARASQVDLEVPRMFDLSVKTLRMFSLVEETQTLKITIAFLLKALAFMGFTPRFSTCVLCGGEVDTKSVARVAFSSLEGGVVCAGCETRLQTLWYPAEHIRWLQAFLYSTLDEVATYSLSNSSALEMIHIVSDLIQAHMGISLTSLCFLFSHPC